MNVAAIADAAVRCVLPWKATVGESPLWSSREQRLYWIDIQERLIHRFDPVTAENESFTLPEIVTSLALRGSGGLVLTLTKDFATFEPATGELQRLGSVEGDRPQNRFNDGSCDPQGRFFSGTMDTESWSAPSGHLFRLDGDRSLHAPQKDVVCSNGMGWSPDGRVMYHTESFRHVVYAYDFDPTSGAMSNRRAFITIDPHGGGFPDGMTVDAAGYVWSCIVGLGQIRRYDPLGELERVVQLPVPRATDCTFGGPGLTTLFITSARETMSAAELERAPLSGSLFAYECGVAGLAPTPFAG
jgi:sugar lactone lactonase YvrE